MSAEPTRFIVPVALTDVMAELLPLSNITPVVGVRAKAVCPIVWGVHVPLSPCVAKNAGAVARRLLDGLANLSRAAALATLAVQQP